MKYKIYAIVLAAIFLTFGISNGQGDSKKVANLIAVMDLTCGTAIDKESCQALTGIVIDELVKSGKYKVIDRANRDKILSEQGFQQTACVADQCSVEAGRLLGVGKIVVGNISKIGQTFLINLQLVNVETGALETSAGEECKCDIDGLITASRNAAKKLMGEVSVEEPPAATTQEPLTAEKGVLIPPPPPGKAIIIFYRYLAPSPAGANIKYELVGDIGQIGSLPHKSCIAAVLDPGTHHFWVGNKKSNVVPIEAKAGEVYFVELSIYQEVLKFTPMLTTTSASEGRARIKRLKYMSGEE